MDRSAGRAACWPWTGQTKVTGHGSCAYGVFYVQRGHSGRTRKWKAHRIALALSLGRTLARRERARHLCHNPVCCNPAHLVPGTQAQNAADRVFLAAQMAAGMTRGAALALTMKIRQLARLIARGQLSLRAGLARSDAATRIAVLSVTGGAS